MSIILAKFGGTSLKDATAMNRSAMVAIETKANIIVVSATAGTTNLIKNLIEKPEYRENFYQELKKNHLNIARDLNISLEAHGQLLCLLNDLETTHAKLLGSQENLHSLYQDELFSFGERLSSLLFTQALKNLKQDVVCEDARNFLKTDSQFLKATPQIDKIATMSQVFLGRHDENKVIVTQGFIGSDSAGRTTTLGRGGSDYSAALIAEALKAQTLYIWTDVSGILTVDPRINPAAQNVLEISYQEAMELASFGAKVLHPATLLPAMRAQIPIFVGSSGQHKGLGTWVKAQTNERPFIRALAKRDNQKLLTVTSVDMVGTHGFLAKLFQTLSHYQVSVDMVTTSEASVALTLDGDNNGSGGEFLINPQMIEELKKFCQVKIETDLSLIALVGNDMHFTPGLGTRTFSSLSQFNIRSISHGASSHSLCFLVKSIDANKVINLLHKNFIENELPAAEVRL